MTKVKICGITNEEDALLGARFGADALGFNFYAKSPRYIAPERARAIVERLPEGILKVGVFVNEELERIVEIAGIAGLDALQLHGEESPEFARELKAQTNLEIIKAFRVSPDFEPEDVLKYDADAILLDAYSPREHGGTGETFDWQIAKKVREIFPKMYLAGGLGHDNVRRAIAETEAYAVDVCSGIEQAKGVKDRSKTINFLTKAKVDLKKLAPNSFDDFFTAVLLRPAMYFGKKSISDLQTFMRGFVTALDFANSDFDLGGYDTEEYRKWMGEKIGYGHPNSFDCMTHILRKFDGDEEKSFDYFLALWEEFKLERKGLSDE